MRDLSDVIDRILKHVPVERDQLIARLKSIQSSSQFAAPEMQRVWWRECAQLLYDEIPEIIKDWEKEIADIFGGVEDENKKN